MCIRDSYIPFTTLQTIYNKGDKLNNLVMTTKNLETVEANEAFEAHYRKVLGANHRFDPTDPVSYTHLEVVPNCNG